MKHNLTVGRMSDFFLLRMGKTPPRDNPSYWNSGTNAWVAISDMGKSICIDKTNELITDTGVSECNMQLVPSGTVIMSFKLSIGKVAITNKPLYTNEAIMAFIPKPEIAEDILVKYTYYYLKGYHWGGTGKKAVMGITLNKASLSATQFSYPPMEVQEQIVAELDKINEVIEDSRELLRNLDALAQSLFYDYFGDPVTNPKGWDTSSIENICKSIVRGPFGGALKKEIFVAKSTNTYKVYEQKHAIKKNATLGSYYIKEEDFKRLKRFELCGGDFIMSCSGTIGEFFQIPANAEPGVMNQALLKFSLKDKIAPVYFLFLMKDIKRIFTVYGTGLQNISSVSTVKSIYVPVPPLSLQEQFAARIEQIEAQKRNVEETIATMQTLLESRMDYWFN